MPIIDTRNKRNGRTIVPEGAASRVAARVEADVRRAKAGPPKPKPEIVPPVTFDAVTPKHTYETRIPVAPAADPRSWKALSKDANYSISGLGSTRRFKRYPGKVFPMAAAQWRESPASAERAARAAIKAKAKQNKNERNALKSL